MPACVIAVEILCGFLAAEIATESAVSRPNHLVLQLNRRGLVRMALFLIY